MYKKRFFLLLHLSSELSVSKNFVGEGVLLHLWNLQKKNA